MSKTKDLKLIIIENFIDWFSSDEQERDNMKGAAGQYVDGDHVDEIADFINDDVAGAVKQFAEQEKEKTLSLS